MDNIQNIMLNIINNYNYENEVNEFVESFKKHLENMARGKSFRINDKISDRFEGYNDENIANKVAKQVIDYKIQEKAFIKLMTEGLIYPIQVNNGWFSKLVTYENEKWKTETRLYFRILVFSDFMKV